VLAAGKDLFHALDAVERVNTNAYCLLSRRARMEV